MVLISFPFSAVLGFLKSHVILDTFACIHLSCFFSPLPFTWLPASSGNAYFSRLISFLPFSSAAPWKSLTSFHRCPSLPAVAHFGLFFCFFLCPVGDGPSPHCCPFTVPPESEREMNKWTEILPLIIVFCFLAPVVHPPPAAQRWSSLITLLPGCSVFEQQEGKKERKQDGPGEGRKNHGELVNGIFVFWNEILEKTRHKVNPLCQNWEISFHVSCQILKMCVIPLHQLTAILKMYLTTLEHIISLKCPEAVQYIHPYASLS